MWYLVNQESGARLAVSDQGITIGRENCDMQTAVDDLGASRRHAQLLLQGNRIIVSDLGSKNGTFIGGTRITQGVLGEGQTLRCGKSCFILERVVERQASDDFTDRIAVSPFAVEPTIVIGAARSVAPQEPSPPADRLPPLEFPSEVRQQPVAYRAPSPPPPRFRNPPQQRDSAQVGGMPVAVAFVVSLVALILGIAGWQHYQPLMDTVNSPLGQLGTGLLDLLGSTGDEWKMKLLELKIAYYGSLGLALVGLAGVITCIASFAQDNRN